MKSMLVAERGSNSLLRWSDVQTPAAGESMLLVKVKAAGVNFADLMQLHGTYPRRLPTPYVPGYEVAGEIVEVGANVRDWIVGQRVMGLMPSGGGYAEYALLHPRLAIELPREIDFADSTALLTQGLTAFIMVDKFVGVGQSVLITAAAGGVGAIALQLALSKGARPVYGVARGAEKVRSIEGAGGIGVDYGLPNWVAELKSKGVRANIILDAVGGETLQEVWSLLNDFGTLVSYGNASFSPLALSAEQIVALPYKNQSLHFYGFSRYLEAEPGLYRTGISTLLDLVSKGALKLSVQCRYPLSKAQNALDDLRDRKIVGKAVLSID